MVITKESLLAALGDLFLNPDQMRVAADEIDCGAGCMSLVREDETGANHCLESRGGFFCPNDVAEMLRRLADLASRDRELK